MSASGVVTVFGVGAAALALWILVKFPAFGPQGVITAFATATAALVLQSPLVRLVPHVTTWLDVQAALLLVVLPALTLLFWGVGCLIRSLVAVAAPYRR
jgi:hypothetical protein